MMLFCVGGCLDFAHFQHPLLSWPGLPTLGQFVPRSSQITLQRYLIEGASYQAFASYQ